MPPLNSLLLDVSVVDAMKIRVQYEVGLAGEPEPAVVWFGSRRLAVNAVVDRWYGTNRLWWKLDTDGGVYILRCEEGKEDWDLAAVPHVRDRV
jgi:hypothetical protein